MCILVKFELLAGADIPDQTRLASGSCDEGAVAEDKKEISLLTLEICSINLILLLSPVKVTGRRGGLQGSASTPRISSRDCP